LQPTVLDVRVPAVDATPTATNRARKEVRTPMNNFTYSDAGFQMTRSFEGLRLTTYQDCAGIWTIGHGHTDPAVTPGKTITEPEAEALLHADLAAAVTCVNSAVNVSIRQCQFDAVVDFCFNADRGSLLKSTLLRLVNLGDFAQAAEQFALWVHAGREVVPGLVRRRKAEAELIASLSS
jgi:lysozyme